MDPLVRLFGNQNLTIDNYTDHLDLLHLRLEYFIICWNGFLLLIGFPCNLVVACIAFSLVRQRSNRGDASLNKPTQLLILNLSIIDILALVLNAGARFTAFVRTDVPCWVLVSASHWSTIASSLGVLCLNVDRFVAILRPLHYAVIVTKSRIFVSIALCWIVATGWVSFFISRTLSTISGENACLLSTPVLAYYAAYTCVFFILPNCVALALSICVALIVLRTHGRKSWNRSAQSSTRLRFQDSNQSMKRPPPTKTKMLTFVFVATIWQVITSLLYRSNTLAAFLYGDGYMGSRVADMIVGSLFLALMSANPAGNPFVTILTQRRYRLAIREKLSKRKATNATASNTGVTRQPVYSVQNDPAIQK